MSEGAQWRKSSYSGGGDCLEWIPDADGIRLRDSKNRSGPELLVTHSEWRAFLATVKARETDTPAP